MKHDDLLKIKEIIKSGSRKMELTKILLCKIALGEKIPEDFYNNRKSTQVFNGLRRYKFIRRVKKDRKYSYSITQKGEARLHDIIIDEIRIMISKKWDGKWRLVMYDFPIRFKKARNAFRWKLKDLGFLQFQKSAWIYPHQCEEEVLFVAEFFGVKKYVEILEVSKVSSEKKLKDFFGLYGL